MKQYAVFVWEGYDARGGWNDLYGSYDSVSDGCQALRDDFAVRDKLYQVIDLESGEKVSDGRVRNLMW